MAPPGGRTLRVLVVQKFFAHYRLGLVRQLAQSEGFEFSFAGDIRGSDGIEVVPASELAGFLPLRNRWFGPALWQTGLFKIAIGGQFDVVVLSGDASHVSTWLAAAVFRMRGVTTLMWTIGWHRPDRGLKRVCRLAHYRLAERLLLYSTRGQDTGIEMGYPHERMRVIYNSCEPMPEATVDSYGMRAVAEDHVPRVGAVIRLTAPKRLDLLIRAVSIACKSGRMVSVLLVGDGPEREHLVALARALGVRLDVWPATYSRGGLADAYREISVTVVPSAIGLTCIQSLSHGVPCLSDDDALSQMPEWEAIIPGVTGDTYTSGDAGALSQKICVWLDRIAKERDTIRDACVSVVRDKWSVESQARRFCDGIREISSGDTK